MVAKVSVFFTFEHVLVHFTCKTFHDAKLRELNIG